MEEGENANSSASSLEDNKIDAASPYYLGSGDNPGNTITHIQLRGDNYDEWARSIRLSLRARRKFGFVDGSITKPTTPNRLEDWITVQSMIVSWIMRSVEPTVASSIFYYDDAKSLWVDLQERFCVVNGPRIQQLKAALADCRQTRTMSVMQYFGKLKTLWDELGRHEPILGCECGECTCGIAKRAEKRREDEHFHQFMIGLDNDLYGTVRSNLLSQDPLPSLNRAYQTIIQEERVRGISRETVEREEVSSFAVKTGLRGKGQYEKKDKSNLFCSHCERDGHDQDHCFLLVGFPDWWGDRPRNGGRGAGKGRGGVGSAATISTGRGRAKSVRANTIVAPNNSNMVAPTRSVSENSPLANLNSNSGKAFSI